MGNKMPVYTSVLYYLILALVLAGLVWSYFLPVEITVAGRGFVSFLDDPQAVSVPLDGIVDSVCSRGASAVKKGEVLLNFRDNRGESGAETAATAISSPADGVLMWQRDLLRGDFIRAGERLALVYPASTIGVKVYLPEKDLGRIKAGMPVRVSLDAYPYQNYGLIRGTVRDFVLENSGASGREMHLALYITLEETPPELSTIMPGLAANVEIITGQTRLLKQMLF
ncbi:HlyD family efflux transporter periplasmic adaptor subunit [Candidatus Micrarchaeota archaeon]|nr:HlyD family efflux transporter periplasmic adaptor subunit [Candidatus Micrarchaeota archaeon]